MRILVSIFLLLFVISLVSMAQVERPLGINLSPVHDFSTEFVFVDAFKQSRTWISHNADGSGAWDTNVNIPLDERGYPLAIPYDDGLNPPQAVRALLLWDLVGPFPSGEYRLIVEGEGQVSMEFGAVGTFTCPVDTIVNVTGSLAISIDASSEGNPISDIRFIRPNYIDVFEDQTFTDELLAFLDDFQVIRFMDWLRTNDSPVSQWGDRSTADYYTQTLNSGVAWEFIVQLANELEKDIWINVPHEADDDYVAQLAGFLEDELNGESRIYLEYSNELWNGIFSQTAYAAEMGNNLGFSGPSWEQGWKFTAYRSAQIFSIFEGTIANDERLVKIIPSQSANAWLSGQLVNYFNDPLYNPEGVEADALAIAPYFAHDVANDIVTNDEVSAISVAEIVSRMGLSLAQSEIEISDNLAVADENNLDLIAYEGGQHLVGTNGNENNDLLTQKLVAANHHPDLEQVYCEYLNYWYEESGQLFAHFNAHYPFSKWGSWGLKETMVDFENPKYMAVQNCVIDANDVSVSTVRANDRELTAYPNPSRDGHFTITNLPAEHDLLLFDLMGKQIDADVTHQSATEVQIFIPEAGVYILKCGAESLRLVVH